MAKKYWLMKSEPYEYSIDDLKRDGKIAWTGVRNYQARNLMRDEMSVGDGIFYYHSNKDRAIVGIARVGSKPYPDHLQFDKKSKYYDEKATKDEPRWFLVDVEYVAHLDEPIELGTLKAMDELSEMALVQKFQRLSVQPVSKEHWKIICKLAGIKQSIV